MRQLLTYTTVLFVALASTVALAQKVTSPDRDRSRQHPLAVLRNPDEVNLENCLSTTVRLAS